MERGDARNRLGPSVTGLNHDSTVGTGACSGLHWCFSLLVIVRSLSEFFRLQCLHGEALVIALYVAGALFAAVALFVRASQRTIEFEKGKAGVAVASLDKLPALIDTLITAIRNGELDEQLAAAAKSA